MRIARHVSSMIVLVLCVMPTRTSSQTLAERYPGDVGIASDPAVVFAENFEEATLNDVFMRWSDVSNGAGMSFDADIPALSSGAQSLRMTSRIGNNTGGHLYISFPAGHDLLYARFYVKFMSGCKPIHHFVTMGGYNPPTPWPQGGAGIRPDGSERFTTGIEPFGTSWRWDFYTYWMHMRGNPTPDFWGNDFTPTPSAQVPCDQWLPVELMMRLNNPVTSFNGEQAFWVDGVRAHHLGEGFPNGDWVWDTFTPSPGGPPFEGFQWRIDPNLRLSFFWLLYYITQGPAGQQDAVLFDDLVIATEYIGPITNAAPTPRLFAYRSGADVRLVWEDTGRSSYRLDRAEAPDLTGRMPIFQGAGLTTSDVAAVPAAASYYYSVD